MSDIGELIDGGATIRNLRRHFRTREESLQFYASYFGERYSLPSAVGGQCCICTADGCSPVAYRWVAMLFSGVQFGPTEFVLLFLGHIGLTVQHEVIAFETFHPVCQSCWRSIRRRKRIAPVLNFIAFASLLFGLFIAPMGFLSPLFGKFKPSETTVLILVGLGGVALIALYPTLMLVVRRLQIPPTLRQIPRRPFQYGSSRLA